MSDILIVTATQQEAVFPTGYGELLVTGPGILATAFHITRALERRKYRLAINIGVCGSLDDTLDPGTVVHVISDRLADFGAEDGEHFLPAADIGLLDGDKLPFSNGILMPAETTLVKVPNHLPRRNGITVQKVHGSERSSLEARLRFGPATESMEGAAFFYCCMMAGIPCLQIRAVSNKVEKRNRPSWQIELALDNLRGIAKGIAEEYSF